MTVSASNRFQNWMISVAVWPVLFVAAVFVRSLIFDAVVGVGLLCILVSTRVIGRIKDVLEIIVFCGAFPFLWGGMRGTYMVIAAAAWFALVGLAVIRQPRRVKAAELAGEVQWKSEGVPGVLVEECSANWEHELAETRTGADGRFALPQSSEGPVHYLRFTWGQRPPELVKVRIVPVAPPLVVRIKGD